MITSLTKLIEEPTRRRVKLDVVLTNREWLMRNVKLEVSLGCSDHKMVELEILRVVRRVCSKLATLDFRRGTVAS